MSIVDRSVGYKIHVLAVGCTIEQRAIETQVCTAADHACSMHGGFVIDAAHAWLQTCTTNKLFCS